VVLAIFVCMPALASGGEAHAGYDWHHFWAWLTNAIIFFGGLAYILRKPVGEFFSNRRTEIQDSLSRAEQSRKEAAMKLQEIEVLSKNLVTEVADILAQATADAAREKERLIKLAQTEAAKIGEQAKTEIANMESNAKSQLRAFLADLAVKEAEKVVVATMTDAERNKLFVDFSARMGAQA